MAKVLFTVIIYGMKWYNNFSGKGHSRQSLPAEEGQEREIILTDVSLSGNNSQRITQSVEFDQEVEIRYLPKPGNSNNSRTSKSADPGQENIEPQGPVRVLSFTDCEEKPSHNTALHRPKPVLPQTGSKKNKDKNSSENSTAEKQSAFSRVVKNTKTTPEEKLLPGELELGRFLSKFTFLPFAFTIHVIIPKAQILNLNFNLEISLEIRNIRDINKTWYCYH